MRAILLLCLVGGCFNDVYRCSSDADCDLGEGGRCELDGHCTEFDNSCATAHSYTAHSEELTGTCFDDRQTLSNLCAGGQGPGLDGAAADPCIARVCTTLPACCAVGWTDACVQAAELEPMCGLGCTTSIAVTATKGARTELWELTWNGTSWTAVRHDELDTMIAWVGPAPGQTEPRLAGMTDNATRLQLGTQSFPLDAGRVYQTITTIDVDRDGRDTAVLTYQQGTSFAQVLKLDDGTSRVVQAAGPLLLVWGDSNHDGFPDGVVGAGTKYTLLDNIDGDGAAHVRSLLGKTSANINGMGTPGQPTPLRNFDWLDFDGDHQLDLLVSGNSVRVHPGPDGITDTQLFNLDCNPPAGGGSCDDTEFSLFAIALPTSAGPALAEAPFRDNTKPPQVRAVFKLVPGPQPQQIPQATALAFTDTCTTACVPIIALVARDLDGDHEMDLVAIDADLRIYTALGGAKFGLPQALPTSLTGLAQLKVSVSGTLKP